jgi:transposase
MRKIREVIRLRQCLQLSVREIAASCAIGRTTVGEYLRRTEAAGLGWPLPGELDDQGLERRLFPPPATGEGASRPIPDWPQVRRELSRKGVTLSLLWHEYKRLFEDGYGYSRYAELYRAWEKTTELSMLQRHKAGQKLFVDFAGLTMPVTDPATGEVRKVQIYSGAMGASQHIFAKAYESQELQSWLEANADALEFYGAVPEMLVPDNLKSGVTSADRYEPVVNPSFAEFARHYGLAVVPARPRRPRDKPKAENAVLQVERWILAPVRNRTFFSLEDLNEAIALKLEELADRHMKGPDATRRQLFEELDRPAMRPLPSSRYVYAAWKRIKVGPDYHVELEGHRYSVPYTLVGTRVDLRAAALTVEIFSKGKRVCGHVRSLLRRGFTTDPAHMPPGHREFALWTPERLERWALQTGPNASGFVRALMEGRDHPQQAFRACMGVISLSKSYGPERVEAACGRALAYRALSYRNVKTILEKGLDQGWTPATEPEEPGADHANVRGADYYKEASPCAS